MKNWPILLFTLFLSSCYPLLISWMKHGQPDYPFMFSTAIFGKNLAMASYYWIMLFCEQRFSGNRQYTKVVENRLHSPELGLGTTDGDESLPNVPQNWRTKLKRGVWLLPNSLIVIITDVLTFYSLRYVSASTYTLFLQSQMIFIVLIRYFFLKKAVTFQGFVSILQLVLGVTMFQIAKMEGELKGEHLVELFGVVMVIFRSIMKASDIVFVEWFTQVGLGDLTFYEKQSFVGMWFILTSVLMIVIKDGKELVNGRPLFDGWDSVTVIYVLYSSLYAISIYVVIKKMDSVQMGIISLLTVPTTVVLDVLFFGSKMSLLMSLCIGVVLTALLQYKLNEWSQDRVKQEQAELLGASSINLGAWDEPESSMELMDDPTAPVEVEEGDSGL